MKNFALFLIQHSLDDSDVAFVKYSLISDLDIVFVPLRSNIKNSIPGRFFIAVSTHAALSGMAMHIEERDANRSKEGPVHLERSYEKEIAQIFCCYDTFCRDKGVRTVQAVFRYDAPVTYDREKYYSVLCDIPTYILHTGSPESVIAAMHQDQSNALLYYELTQYAKDFCPYLSLGTAANDLVRFKLHLDRDGQRTNHQMERIIE